ncbi:MAG TPA: hypothetical protein VH206_05795 [Xanthobacteraceae bacterium]|jgi:hypothetical protein|nr:hypothetical protein [Xanthobacteraceae bacterium]
MKKVPLAFGVLLLITSMRANAEDSVTSSNKADTPQQSRPPPKTSDEISPTCQPWPDCRIVETDLKPGANGDGIRDKGLIEEKIQPGATTSIKRIFGN